MQPAVKADLREIWQAETRAAAATAMNTFAEKYGAKYEKAVACLSKDREALLGFYDLPADHWDHLRTGNPIESVFATVRHRTVRTKGALSQKTAKLMVFKLVQAAAKTWRRLKGANQLPLIIEGVTSPRVSPPASPRIARLDQAASPRFPHSSALRSGLLMARRYPPPRNPLAASDHNQYSWCHQDGHGCFRYKEPEISTQWGTLPLTFRCSKSEQRI